MFPTRIVQSQDGFPALDLTVASVTRERRRRHHGARQRPHGAAGAGPASTSPKLADGVFYLTGGTHHSLAVEMNDHIVLVDTPKTEERALAVIAKTKEVIPNKPIRFVVTSHHHWDHLGGIRAAIDEGATIVTHAERTRRFSSAWRRRRTRSSPIGWRRRRSRVKIQTVGAKGTLTDGTRTIELHLLTNYEHTGDMLVVVSAEGEDPGRARRLHAAGDADDAARRDRGAVRRGAVRQHPAPQARRADDRAVPRRTDDDGCGVGEKRRQGWSELEAGSRWGWIPPRRERAPRPCRGPSAAAALGWRAGAPSAAAALGWRAELRTWESEARHQRQFPAGERSPPAMQK